MLFATILLHGGVGGEFNGLSVCCVFGGALQAIDQAWGTALPKWRLPRVRGSLEDSGGAGGGSRGCWGILIEDAEPVAGNLGELEPEGRGGSCGVVGRSLRYSLDGMPDGTTVQASRWRRSASMGSC